MAVSLRYLFLFLLLAPPRISFAIESGPPGSILGADSERRCHLLATPFLGPELKGAQFVSDRDRSLHMSFPVIRTAQANGLSISGDPTFKVAAWFRHLASLYDKVQRDAKEVERIKEYYLGKHVIRPEQVPQSFFDLQLRIARARGQGDQGLSPALKSSLAEILVNDQRGSLTYWLDYLFSADTSQYPIWAKYWCFSSVIKLGVFEGETGLFAKRSRTSVAPFTELNREALAVVMDQAVAAVESTQSSAPVPALNFGNMYGKVLRSLHNLRVSQSSNAPTAGKWVIYKRGSEANPLVESLRGRNTGWCTAGKSTAEAHLSRGDFHVYYSHDENGEPRVPRIAIRMELDRIGEVRGVARDQNLDNDIAGSGVLEAKLKTFGVEAEGYEKKSRHMKLLTELEQKRKVGIALSRAELRFLYELEEKIIGFGHGADPRIKELQKTGRDLKQELIVAVGGTVRFEEISLTAEDALKPGIKIHFGDLDLSKVAEMGDITFPEAVYGNLKLHRLTSVGKLVLPRFVGGDLDLGWLRTFSQLILPETVLGALDLSSIQSPEGLVLPKNISGQIAMTEMRSAKGLKFPEVMHGQLYLSHLKTTEGLHLPRIIYGDLNLSSINSAVGLTLPKVVSGTLAIGVVNPDNLVLPKEAGSFFLEALVSADDLVFPEVMNGRLLLRSVKSVKRTVFPKHIGEIIDLRSLESAVDLVLPDFVGKKINVPGLKSVEGLILPKAFKGVLVSPFKSEQIPFRT